MTPPRRPGHVVVDASVIVDLLASTDVESPLARLLDDPEVEIHVPELCDVEVAAALRRAVLRGWSAAAVAEQKLAIYVDLPMSRYGHEPCLRRIFALRDNFTAYDATYVALAEALEAPLLTADRPLAAAVRVHTAVSVIEAI